MMRLITCLLFIVSVGSASAQRIIDSVEIYGFPVRKAVIYEYDPKSSGGCRIFETTAPTLFTWEDTVYHFESGKVVGVYNLGDWFAVGIMNAMHELITYSNLKNVTIKKGDTLNKGMFLGNIVGYGYGEMNEIDVLISDSKGKPLSYQQTVNYIRNKISSSKQCTSDLITNTF